MLSNISSGEVRYKASGSSTPNSSQTTPKFSQATPKSSHATPKSSSATPKSSNATPKSSHSRAGWSVFVCSVGSKLQMHILCKRSSGRMGPFSSAGPASQKKPIWEPITECKFQVKMSEGEAKQDFMFKNTDNESKAFRADLMDPLMAEMNTYTQKSAALLVKNPRLLAAYLTLLSHSEEFCTHEAKKHDKKGFDIENGIEAISKFGGCLSDYEEFRKAALENATVIGQNLSNNIKISPMAKKRKLTDYFNKTDKKMSNSEKVEKNYQDMIAEEGGLEKTVASAYVKCRQISVDKLSLSPDLFLPINQVKVNEIAESMMERLEVSQLVVSVVPTDIERFDREGDDDHFFVVHGAHRFEAFKKVDVYNSVNKDKPVCGFPKDRSITCFILKVNAASLTNYVNIKCNDISTKFQSSASNEALIFVHRGLLDKGKDPAEALEIIEKIASSRRLGRNELAVYRKLTDWPLPVLDKLIQVLDKFQSYQTADANQTKARQTLKKRIPNSMAITTFRLLGGCTAEFFMENHGKVLNNLISLKDLLEESDKKNKISKDELKFVACAGDVKDMASLQAKYPGRFTPEVIQQYSGAEVFGRKRNLQGQRLKSYVKKVKEGVSFEDPIKVKEFKHFSDVSAPELESFDVTVLHAGTNNLDWIKTWVDLLCCSDKDFFSVLIIVESQELLVNLYESLLTWKDKPDFRIFQCLFRKLCGKSGPRSCADGIIENVSFAVLFGKLNVVGEIKSLNDDISKDLRKVVSKVTPPGGIVGYVSQGIGKVHQVHQHDHIEKSAGVQFIYFVAESELMKVKKMFFEYVTVTREDTREENKETEDDTDDSGHENRSEDDEMSGNSEEKENFKLVRQSSTSSTKYA